MYRPYACLVLLVSLCDSVFVNLSPRTTFQHTVHLPLKESGIAGEYNLLLVAEEGASGSDLWDRVVPLPLGFVHEPLFQRAPTASRR